MLPSVSQNTIAAYLLLACAASGFAADSSGKPSRKETINAWRQVESVLRHPRCMNCHQHESPLQGDSRRVHIPRVFRGVDNQGVGAMRCQNCHNNVGNNDTSRTPGAKNWQLAPLSMQWEGLSSAKLCRMLKDPARNGKRSPESLIEHMETEHLVLWGWAPGKGRETVPVSHEEFIRSMKVWVAGGTGCPN